jgi:hypothetical protein
MEREGRPKQKGLKGSRKEKREKERKREKTKEMERRKDEVTEVEFVWTVDDPISHL